MRGKWAVIPVTIIAVAIIVSGPGAVATHEPANKVSGAGATSEVISPNTEVVLLSEKVKTSKPTDLILGVTAECAITTELTTTGNDVADAFGLVRIWVEIDGVPVPVSVDDTTSPGKVVFCNRAESRRTSLFDDDDATIETFQRTRQANAFNWMALDVGSATHLIEVMGELTHGSNGDASALAAVGKRTLIIEPVKSANDEAVTELA